MREGKELCATKLLLLPRTSAKCWVRHGSSSCSACVTSSQTELRTKYAMHLGLSRECADSLIWPTWNHNGLDENTKNHPILRFEHPTLVQAVVQFCVSHATQLQALQEVAHWRFWPDQIIWGIQKPAGGTGIDIGWYWDIHNQHLAASSVGQQVSRTPEMKAQDSRCYKTSLLDHLAESFPVGSTNCHRGMVGWASRHTALQLLRCLPRVIGSWIWWSVTKGLDQTTSSEEIWSHNLPGFFWKWIGWKVSKR